MPAGGFWVERARGSSSRSASAVSKSSLFFVRAEKSARGLELPAATRIGIYVKLEECQARTGGIQFSAAFPAPSKQRSFCKCRTLLAGTPRALPHVIPSRKSRRAAADFLPLKAPGLLPMQNTQDWNNLHPATHYPSPQTTGWAGIFEFVRNSWQEVESRSTLSIAGHPQGARCLPGCHRAACASEASWPRMAAMEADAGGAGWEACQMDCIPPSTSVLCSSAFPLRPGPWFQLYSSSGQHPVSSVLKKIKKGMSSKKIKKVLEKNKKRC